MQTNVIQLNDHLPPKANTILKVIVYPEKQATIRQLNNSAKITKELQLKHPNLPEGNLSFNYNRERVLF